MEAPPVKMEAPPVKSEKHIVQQLKASITQLGRIKEHLQEAGYEGEAEWVAHSVAWANLALRALEMNGKSEVA